MRSNAAKNLIKDFYEEEELAVVAPEEGNFTKFRQVAFFYTLDFVKPQMIPKIRMYSHFNGFLSYPFNNDT